MSTSRKTVLLLCIAALLVSALVLAGTAFLVAPLVALAGLVVIDTLLSRFTPALPVPPGALLALAASHHLPRGTILHTRS